MEISEHEFEEVAEFFKCCSQVTGKEINGYSLNKTFKSRWDSNKNQSVVIIDDKYVMTFDSGGYTLISVNK